MMKYVIFSFIVCLIASCTSDKSSHLKLEIADSLQLPGIVSQRTLHLNEDLLFYEAGDDVDPSSESFKCFSISRDTLLWSVGISAMGVNEGRLALKNEYVAPTIDKNTYIIDSYGDFRILALQNSCKIIPIIYDTTFVIQDNGVGLRCFGIKSLREIWRIPLNSSFTISQPVRKDSLLIYVDDNVNNNGALKIINIENGDLVSCLPLLENAMIQSIVTNSDSFVFILSQGDDFYNTLISVEINALRIVWSRKLEPHHKINLFEKDIVLNNGNLYCRGDSNVLVIDAINGVIDTNYLFPHRLASNIVADAKGQVWFMLGEMEVVCLRSSDAVVSFSSNHRFTRMYVDSMRIMGYAYPNLYFIEQF